MTILFTHQSCLLHEVPRGHPENPARLKVLETAFAADEFKSLNRRDAPLGKIESIALMHSRSYIEDVTKVISEEEFVHLDADTSLSHGSSDAALRGCGAVCAAIDAVMIGDTKNVFCAVRPPGHHAETRMAMGFCLFNNVAIGAAYARERFKVDRVAVVDFDVHHGNGTQEMFWSQPNLLYASTHQMPLFPGTGAASEIGDYNNIINVPLSAGDGSLEFRAAFNEIILPELKKFKPELLIISAGFDAHANDPLAQLNLYEDDYAWVTLELLSIAEKYSESRVVSVLEGGYNLDALRSSASIHVRQLMSV
jgi:acetoin utilization deacetylase AcuC-like enzyme